MSARPFRFRRFSVRLLVMLLTLLIAALATTYVLVSRANEANAIQQSHKNLDLGARVFQNTIEQRVARLRQSAEMMSWDYAIRSVFLQDRPDVDTLTSSLENFARRIEAQVALFEPGGELIAHYRGRMDETDRRPFKHLIKSAEDDDEPEANGIAYQDNNLHVLLVRPMFAPPPNIAAWFGLAFAIDKRFAQQIKDTTQLEVTFVSTEDAAQPRVLATTLPDTVANHTARAAAANVGEKAPTGILDVPGERYVTLFKFQEMPDKRMVTIVLQRPLSAELAAARRLEHDLILISLATLLAGAGVALWIARGVSNPVQQLAAHTRVIAKGDYERRIALDRSDELGQLAESFNSMSAGLAERDRVRDLLDKNVSPEVAAQLMRDGAALGGEEREVTVLFVDLRGFTTMSEKLAPRDLLALLNRYLDRMSVEIELHGGVIDKFIGDAIMALFGAPVAQGDSADRALGAALAMEKALSDLNATLATEGRSPLAFGIGINTARVVAGNIGSHRRLNYSVIGDGVNVASRLQSLTRDAAHRTNIIASAATVQAARGTYATRPLGTVIVKGRTGTVAIFAIEQKPPSA